MKDVIIVDNYVEINGIKYEPIPQRSSKLMSKLLGLEAMAMAMMPAMNFYGGSNYSRKPPRVDLISEYGLIQNKKSNLSKWDRDWVVAEFERNFKKVEPKESSQP